MPAFGSALQMAECSLQVLGYAVACSGEYGQEIGRVGASCVGLLGKPRDGLAQIRAGGGSLLAPRGQFLRGHVTRDTRPSSSPSTRAASQVSAAQASPVHPG